MPISEIAEQIGYTTTSDLYKAFKKIYGISPAAYRSENSL
jgi:AraC-like DNA-binding protein